MEKGKWVNNNSVFSGQFTVPATDTDTHHWFYPISLSFLRALLA
jgi:hypothetical protein